MLVVCLEFLQNRRQIPSPKKRIHLRDFLFQIVLVALRKTTGYVHLIHQTLLFGIYILKDGVDRLLLGIVYESAGVDDDDVIVIGVGLMAGVDAVTSELGQQDFGIHQVFGATHGDDIDFVFL